MSGSGSIFRGLNQLPLKPRKIVFTYHRPLAAVLAALATSGLFVFIDLLFRSAAP
jgi:hypothetical protein